MVYCRECGVQQPDGAAYCVQCGARLPVDAGHATQAAKGEGMSVGAYVGALLLFSIPLAGLILAIVWACGGTENPHKKNLARAWLIVALIGAVLGILIAVAVGGLLATTMIGISAIGPQMDSFDADVFEGIEDYLEGDGYGSALEGSLEWPVT